MNRPSASQSGPETDRTIGDLLRVGVIESVDLEAGKAVVRFGDQLTPAIDWLMSVGDTTVWVPPTTGQQVAVISPEGDVEQAFIVGGLPSSAMAPLFLGLQVAVRFSDGAQVAYDPQAQALDIQTPGTITLNAPAGVAIIGDTTITGDLTVSQTVTAATDVVGGGKSLKDHKHTGVATGGGVSGKPE